MTTRSLVERTGTFFGLVLVAIIFGALVGPQFFAPTNLELMARQMAIVSIAAVGMTIVIVAGGIDLSVGSMMGLAAVSFGAGYHVWHLALPLAAAGAVLVGFAGGALNALLIARLQLPALIVTLGTFSLFRGIAEG